MTTTTRAYIKALFSPWTDYTLNRVEGCIDIYLRLAVKTSIFPCRKIATFLLLQNAVSYLINFLFHHHSMHPKLDTIKSVFFGIMEIFGLILMYSTYFYNGVVFYICTFSRANLSD